MSIARLVIFALSGLVATNAFAATVSVIPQEGTLRGNLYLNRGKGFEPILNITEARTGDSVMASGSGRAAVVYEDGCKVEVSAKTSVVTVQETSPCRGGAVVEAPGGSAVGKWAIGAAVVGGVVAAAVLIGGSGDDDGSGKKEREKPGKPASP